MKGNMFLGMARGSVGDVTFSRLGGQQVARARNRRPNNPRTAAQMTQRALFMCAVNFYSRGVQNLFKFAFEDKRPTESDYNAFMRRNAKNGIYMTKDTHDNSDYPAVGNWIMSYGSLPSMNVKWFNAGSVLFVPLPNITTSAEAASIDTVGKLSAELIKDGWMAGDILTILTIEDFGATVGTATNPIVLAEDADSPNWHITQFIINEGDATRLESIGITVSLDTDIYESAATISVSGYNAGCMFHSRNTSEGLKVSTQSLLNSPSFAQMVSLGRGKPWLDVVLADWDAQERAILEGGATNE